MHQLSEGIERKFVDVIELGDEWEIESDEGWSPITKIMKTVEYEVYRLTLEDGSVLECADDHIIFLSDGSQSFVKNLNQSHLVKTINGLSRVVSVEPLGIFENMYDVEVNTESHSYYSNGILSHNTTVMAGYILWFAIFHSNKETAVLANKGSQAQEIMDRIRMMYEYLPFFMQVGATEYNKTSLVFDNGSKIFSAATSSSSIRGRSTALVLIDEASHIENDLDFFTSTYPVVSSGKESRVIMTTTPKGARGMFYMLWKDSEEGRNKFKTLKVLWDRHPSRDEAWKEETIANIGYSRFAQEFSVQFMGSSGTLIPTDILERLQFKNPINEDEHLQIYEKYNKDRKYFAVCDPSGGTGQDYAVITVLDVTEIPYKVVAKYRNNTISPLLLPHTIINICQKYGECPVLVEANNDVGGQVCYILWYEIGYENTVMTTIDDKGRGARVGALKATPGVKTTKRVKAIGCSNLKTLMENGSLIVEDADTIQELGTFVAKGSSYEADDECHDDCVMTLVLFSWFVKQEYFSDYAQTNIGKHLYEKNKEMAMEELLPFGFIEDGKHNIDFNTGFSVIEGSPADFIRWMNS